MIRHAANSVSPRKLGNGVDYAPAQPPIRALPDLMRDLARVPYRAIVQIVAYGIIHEGEFKYLKNGPNFSILDSIELFNPLERPSGSSLGRSIKFNIREIQEFRIVTESRKRFTEKRKKPKEEFDKTQPVELHLNTIVIQTAQQFKNLVQVLHEVDVLGLSFEGENVSRHGQVSWIVMTARKTLIPLDVFALSQTTPNLWETMKKSIFGNSKLIKIFHDVRPAADYLLHQHDIELVNVFDTQIADAVVVKNSTGFHPAELRSLSEILPLYNTRIPPGEIDYLKLYESHDFTSNSPWMGKPLPPPPILKYGALKVKHLVPLRDNLMKKLLTKFTKCVQAHLEECKQEVSPPKKNPMAVSVTLEEILMEELDVERAIDD